MDSIMLSARTAILVSILLQTFIFESVHGDNADSACIVYCGQNTTISEPISCPSGYKCEKWGCGYQCLRSGQYQPDTCPMVNCVAISCPLGFIRDFEGCEGCTCANETLVKEIKEKYYEENGATSTVVVLPCLLLLPMIYASLQAFHHHLM